MRIGYGLHKNDRAQEVLGSTTASDRGNYGYVGPSEPLEQLPFAIDRP